MKDHEARQKLAVLEERLTGFEKKLNATTAKRNNAVVDVKELKRKLAELLKALGYSHDKEGVFTREIDIESSDLGRLQMQITALVTSLDLEEVYTDGVLSYRSVPKRRS